MTWTDREKSLKAVVEQRTVNSTQFDEGNKKDLKIWILSNTIK